MYAEAFKRVPSLRLQTLSLDRIFSSNMFSIALLLASCAVAAPTSCTSELECSLNGACTGGECVCDKPWGGPGCGVLQYKPAQAVSAKNLYPHNDTGAQAAPASGPCVTKAGSCGALNTWNGPIVDNTKVDGKFHMFNPLYRKGSLLATTAMMHGVAADIEGPYTWRSQEDWGSNPAAVKFDDPATGKTKYAVFARSIYVSDNIDGPWTNVGSGPGGNPAPIFHEGVWYATTQRTQEVVTLGPGGQLGGKWVQFASIAPKLKHGTMEDPFMFIDAKGNWHVINHAYATDEWQHCGNSTLSAHVFSKDGKDWHMLGYGGLGAAAVEPYTHTVAYVDGTSHTYTTLERPNMHFNAQGQPTHINLAADLMSQDAGCPAYDVCPAKATYCACTNCKYADHAGTIIIALEV